ncbi:MAG: aldo/keto reductase [Marinilabiliaceae bacterium]|nr:aldo/keto reductase [Marinilabiliaceae bacterium]
MKITNIKGTFELRNGVAMPYLGLGVFKSKNGAEVENAVKYALDAGYKHIDTAAIYKNEEGVGKAIKKHAIHREELFITSKIWNDDQGYDTTIKAFEASLKRLQTDYLDLYLIHWPVKEKYIDTWKALETLYKDGRVKAIGVSNFLKHHLLDLIQHSSIDPMVNQVECHPLLVQQELNDFCEEYQIQYEAWSPLMQGKLLNNEELNLLARKYKKTVAQIVLRWHLQKGVVAIPKSTHQARIIENAHLFDFELLPRDMALINALDEGQRVGPDPDNFDF